MAASAFTRVPSTRRDFGSPSTNASTSPYNSRPQDTPPQTTKADAFSQELRDYVQRCFASKNAIPGISVDEMQTRLKAIIKEAADSKALYTTDWTNKPLPQQMITGDRQRPAFVTSPQLGSNHSHLKIVDPLPSPSITTNKTNSKKRKSSDIDLDMAAEAALPPWRKMNSVFEDRAAFPTPKEAQAVTDTKKQKRKNGISNTTSVSKSGTTELERRRQRFGANFPGDVSPVRTLREDSPTAALQGPVVGTCETLEKRYFRLTSAPKPETVRPLPVLQKALDFLIKKWKTEHNYSYICDQFKSLRQDLTVQHIKNDFTVLVYETHAHIALEQRDLGEYNQCQTQLRALYKQGLQGRAAEFLAYRILYFIYTGSRTDMSNLLASLSPADRRVPGVKHALDVRSALALGNYHRFFRLYLDAPDMGPYLMDMFIERQRLAAMANIAKAYKPDIPLRFLTDELAFEDDRECAGFICDNGGQHLLESKEGDPYFNTGKGGAIFEAARAIAFRRIDIKGQI